MEGIPDDLEAKLRSLGAVWYDLILPETHTLASVIGPEEEIKGIVYGRYKQIRLSRKNPATIISRGALVATDRRIVLVNKKPAYMKHEEITYKEIRTVTYSWVGLAGTVTLHMEVGDLNLRTFNKACAKGFVAAVESVLFKS